MYTRQISEFIRQSAHRAAGRRDDLDPTRRTFPENAQIFFRDLLFIVKQRSIHIRRDQSDLHNILLSS